MGYAVTTRTRLPGTVWPDTTVPTGGCAAWIALVNLNTTRALHKVNVQSRVPLFGASGEGCLNTRGTECGWARCLWQHLILCGIREVDTENSTFIIPNPTPSES
jgi:hypothetical protein